MRENGRRQESRKELSSLATQSFRQILFKKEETEERPENEGSCKRGLSWEEALPLLLRVPSTWTKSQPWLQGQKPKTTKNGEEEKKGKRCWRYREEAKVET